jgi:hypothetical protein
MPVSVSCSWHVKGDGGDPARLCQSPAPATLREKGGALLGFRPPQASVRGVLVRVFVRGRPAVTHVGVVVLFFIRSPPAVACDFSSGRGRPS